MRRVRRLLSSSIVAALGCAAFLAAGCPGIDAGSTDKATDLDDPDGTVGGACEVEEDCAEGEFCLWECWDCDGPIECAECSGRCAPIEEPLPPLLCESDSDCPEDFACLLVCDDGRIEPGEDGSADPGEVPGAACRFQCVPVGGPVDPPICDTAADCPEGFGCLTECLDCGEIPGCESYCIGICIPIDVPPPPEDCLDGEPCPEGFECLVECPPCEPGVPCTGECYGVCVPGGPIGGECSGPADCGPGLECVMSCAECPDPEGSTGCEPGCFGVCLPSGEPGDPPDPGCLDAFECAPGEVCVIDCLDCPDPAMCEPVCFGVCLPLEEPGAAPGAGG